MLCLNDFLSLGPGQICIFRVPNLQFLVDLIDISKANLVIVSSEDRHAATVAEVKFDQSEPQLGNATEVEEGKVSEPQGPEELKVSELALIEYVPNELAQKESHQSSDNEDEEAKSSDEEGLSDLEEEDINAIQNENDDDFNLEDYLRFKAQLEAEEAKKRELEGDQ